MSWRISPEIVIPLAAASFRRNSCWSKGNSMVKRLVTRDMGRAYRRLDSVVRLSLAIGQGRKPARVKQTLIRSYQG
jgi:hypothetical protein